jgi:RNA polymerase sigma-70 factor (ECF subfamily)
MSNLHHSDFTEEEVLRGLRDGSQAAFEAIYKLYWHRLYLTAYSKVESHAEAEEIVQNIFSTLWEKRQTLLITNLGGYLQISVRNRIINHIRGRITQRKYWEYYKNYMPLGRESTADAVMYDDLAEAVEVAVNRLPEKSRLVFRLNRLEGKSIREIANAMKLSEKAIEYHLTKSIKELKVHLKDFILVLAVYVF